MLSKFQGHVSRLYQNTWETMTQAKSKIFHVGMAVLSANEW